MTDWNAIYEQQEADSMVVTLTRKQVYAVLMAAEHNAMRHQDELFTPRDMRGEPKLDDESVRGAIVFWNRLKEKMANAIAENPKPQ